MGFLRNLIRNEAESPSTRRSETVFIRSYMNMKSFRGTKRLYVTVYGDRDNGMENALALLGEKDQHGCTGSEIVLTGFTFDNWSGIKVNVDGKSVGVVYEKTDPPEKDYYKALFNGNVDGVYVRIERDKLYGEPDRARVYLFIALQG